MSETIYLCYEPDCPSRLSESGWRDYYVCNIDKKEYPDFTSWMHDMIKSGILIKKIREGK